MVKEGKEIIFSYADAAKPFSRKQTVDNRTNNSSIIIAVNDLDDERASLLKNDIEFMGSYSHAVEISNGMDPPAYEAVHPQTILLPRPPSPPSTTLISIYSEPIRIEYEENERLQQQAGCGKFLWNYYACCGYIKDSINEILNDTNSRMFWTIVGCFCCVLPLIALLIIFYIVFMY